MKPEYKNNYFKLVAIIVDVACLVIWKYIREKILGTESFEDFLNVKKHKLVHIYETAKCCECKIKEKKPRLISRKQLLLLYKLDEREEVHDHKKYDGGNNTQICICKYSAIENIDVRVVDITLANYIIQNSGKSDLGVPNWIEQSGVPNWIEQIKDVRNDIFHLSDIQEITEEKFSRKWAKLEGAVMGIAKVVNSAYAVETEKRIMQTKKLLVIGDYMLKYEIMCRDYWKNKCAEFERAQVQIFEEKAAASMVKDYRKTIDRLRALDSKVDNVILEIFGFNDIIKKFDAAEMVNEDLQRIHIPVFLQLDIPTSWDKKKVYEAVDEMRLTGTPEMNIRIKAISRDDLNIYAEMANHLLYNVLELRSEINKMMSSLISDAAINTTEQAKVGVKLRVPECSGVNEKCEGARPKKIQEDVVAVKFFREAIKTAVVEYVPDPLKADIHNSILNLYSHEKFKFITEILTYLAEIENFVQIKSFIEDPRGFAKVWITKLIFENKSNEMNLFTKMAHVRISQIFRALLNSVYKSTESTKTSISIWIEEFISNCNNSQSIPLSTSAFVHVRNRYLPDLQHFVEMLETQFCDIENDVLESFIKEHTNLSQWKHDLVEMTLEKIWGCTEICVFCKIPCIRTHKDHVDDELRHHCAQHRPGGIAGMKSSDNMLILTDCQLIVTTYTGYKDVQGKTGKYIDYRENFPDWDICPSSDISKYWIWILVKFQKELEGMHDAVFPKYPSNWYSISKAEAIYSLHFK